MITPSFPEKNIPPPKLPLPDSKDNDIPKSIGKYKIEGVYAQGGMSRLYIGIDPETEEPIIIKVLLPKFLQNNDVTIRFLNEARIISLADHPNIVKLYDYGYWENGLYIAMEYVKGTPLRRLLALQPFSLKKALDITLQIACAICHLHTHGIIHGDLKPENILITDTGQVKVIDFGIAQLVTEQAKRTIASTPRLIGTPIYMSPEQAEAMQNVSLQSDIYSLGILSFELAIGKITHGRIILSLAPKGLQKILNKALQPKPEDRYQDIVDFIADLTSYMKSGDLYKDKQGSDYFFELFEELELRQSDLVQPLPSWNFCSIGRSTFNHMNLNCLMCDFYDLSDIQKLIYVIEIPKKRAEGIVFSSMLLSSIKTSLREYRGTSPDEIAKRIFSIISCDFDFTDYGISLIFINSRTKKFEFFHNEYGIIVFAQAKSNSIQEYPAKTNLQTSGQFFTSTGFYEDNDALVFLGMHHRSLSNTTSRPQQIIIERMPQRTLQTAQRHADLLFRKIRSNNEIQSEDEHPLILLELQFRNNSDFEFISDSK